MGEHFDSHHALSRPALVRVSDLNDVLSGLMRPSTWLSVPCSSHRRRPWFDEIVTEDREEVNKMKFPKSLGMLLLSIWLIVSGLTEVVSLPIPSIDLILAALAIASGFFILTGR